MQLQKPGIRVLGIAESFSDQNHSWLCGVVMRRDLHIDGFAFGQITFGGEDATEEILRIISTLNRKDLNLIMLSGCVIAWFNIIEPEEIFHKTGLPVICVSYEESEGLREHIERHFPGDRERIKRYEALGERDLVLLPSGFTLYTRGWGISKEDSIRACRLLTLHGKIPEPLRVARLCARGLMNHITQQSDAAK